MTGISQNLNEKNYGDLDQPQTAQMSVARELDYNQNRRDEFRNQLDRDNSGDRDQFNRSHMQDKDEEPQIMWPSAVR